MPAARVATASASASTGSTDSVKMKPIRKIARTKTMERTAQCHRGSLRVIASGEPERVYVCHCRACQRCTGAVVHSGCAIRKAMFGSRATTRFTSLTRTAASRSAFISARMRQAATSFGRADRNPNTYRIAVGSFADPNFPPPTSSVWEEVMHPWLGVATATEHFLQGRPL
jgi:hypothetical protein